MGANAAGFFSDTLRKAVLDAARVTAGRVAADIGAGTGFIAQGLADRGVRVIAVDRSRAMLKELAQRVPAAD